MNKTNTKLSLIECNGAHEITIYFLSAGQKAKGSRGRRISINIYICMYVMAVYASEVWNSHKTIKEKGNTHTHTYAHTHEWKFIWKPKCRRQKREPHMNLPQCVRAEICSDFWFIAYIYSCVCVRHMYVCQQNNKSLASVSSRMLHTLPARCLVTRCQILQERSRRRAA